MTARVANPCLSVKDAAAYVGLSVRTLERIAAEGGAGAIPVVRLTSGPKGRRGFRQRDLDEWLDKRTVGRAL